VPPPLSHALESQKNGKKPPKRKKKVGGPKREKTLLGCIYNSSTSGKIWGSLVRKEESIYQKEEAPIEQWEGAKNTKHVYYPTEGKDGLRQSRH